MRGLAVWVCLVTLSPLSAFAESYERIRVDFGLIGGYASGIGEGGFGGVVEPKLLVADSLAAALRIEGMVTFGASVGGEDASFGTGSAALIAAKGEYLLGTFDVRPAVGLAAGIYAIGGDTISTGPDQTIVSHKSGTYVGLAPSLGVDLGRVRLAATYHWILGADVVVEEPAGTSTTRRDFSQDYVVFELSFHVGGSRVEPTPPSAR